MDGKLYDIKQFKEGSIIYLEGTKPLSHMFVIKEGKVKKKSSYLENETVEVLGAGDTFGFVSCLTGHPYTDRVVALTDCVLIIVERKNIISFFCQDKQTFLKLIKNYSNKVRERDNVSRRLRGVKVKIDKALILLEAARYYETQKMKSHHRYALAKYVENTEDKVNKEKIRTKYQIIPDDCVVYTKFDKELHFKKGDIIFLEYERADLFFLVKKGKVKTTHIYEDKEVILSILVEGDFFGEMALLNDTHRMASAIAYEDCSLMCLTAETFLDSLSDIILEKIFFKCAQRLYQSYKVIANQSLHNPVIRFYDYIDYLIKINQGVRRHDSFTLNFSFEDLKRIIDLSDATEDDFQHILKDDNIRVTDGAMIIKSISKFYERINLKK